MFLMDLLNSSLTSSCHLCLDYVRQYSKLKCRNCKAIVCRNCYPSVIAGLCVCRLFQRWFEYFLVCSNCHPSVIAGLCTCRLFQRWFEYFHTVYLPTITHVHVCHRNPNTIVCKECMAYIILKNKSEA